MIPTTAKKKDDIIDLEQQFILRLPQNVADALRTDISSTLTSLKDKFSIELHLDTRKGKVVYDGHLYHAKLFDLPCIIESLKTTDKKTFYKTADICQMLLCNESDKFEDEVAKVGDDSAKTQKEKDKENHLNHGICPPFKNVRKRRFRKTLQKKTQEQPDVEKELRRLFTADSQAVEVRWEEVVTEQAADDDPRHRHQQQQQQQQHRDDEDDDDDKLKQRDASQTLNIGSKDIFGEVSSSSEDEGNDSKLGADNGQSKSSAENNQPQFVSNNSDQLRDGDSFPTQNASLSAVADIGDMDFNSSTINEDKTQEVPKGVTTQSKNLL